MKQVFVIHGGRTFSTNKEFLQSLQTESIELFETETRRWSRNMQTALGDEYQVIAPLMPNKQNAQYNEWKIWFERHFASMTDDVVLVGWSLGGIFLLKHLSEGSFPFKIKALYLVAAVATFANFHDAVACSFSFDISKASNITKQTDNIVILHSKDDFVVPYEHALRLKEAMPEAELITFADKNHFLIEEFPELVEYIQKLG